MREVSCRVLDGWFRTLEKRRLPPTLLAEGTGYGVAHLRNKHERIEWNAFVRLHENISRQFTEEEMVAIGREWLSGPLLRAFSAPARLLFTTRDMYQRLVQEKSLGQEVFGGCVAGTIVDLSPGHLRLTVSFKPDLAIPRGFFLPTLGVYQMLPTLLGLPRATVVLQDKGNLADYDIRYAIGGGFIARARKALAMPFAMRAAASELQEAHHLLQERYHELDDYKHNLEVKVEQRTAELAQTTRQLEQTIEHLRIEQASRSRIFANLNHEFRTPLSLMLLAVSDVEGRLGDALDDGARQGLGSVERSVRRLLRMIDGLLLLAAGQEDRLQLRLGRIDVAQLIGDLCQTWLTAASTRGLTLTWSGPAHLEARVDDDKLERIVTNLISNALKFTPSGGRVDVTMTGQGDHFEISVSDTGVGIDEDFKSRIFGRFEQNRAPVNSPVSGSGLGLSLVKELTEAHGGSVEVADRPGGGTIFRVRMPIAGPTRSSGIVVEEAPTSVAAPPRRSADRMDDDRVPLRLRPEDFGQGDTVTSDPEVLESPRAGAETVLIAEDQPELRQAIGRLLQPEYRVVLAHDGLHALELAAKHQPHILVSDIGMPNMDGIELTRRFRELSGNRLAPVVLLTARTTMPDRMLGFQAGAVDYVMKPFEPDELRARIRSQLELRNLALKLSESEKLAGLGVLSAGLAHELRNPANAIINAVGPLRSLLPAATMVEGTPTAQLFAVLSDCAQQVAMLSRQLLGLRRDSDLVCVEEPLGNVIKRALSLVRPVFVERGVTLQDGPHWDGRLICAGGLLTQVLCNLLENAAHAAGPGGTVKLQSRLDGDRVHLEVIDSGPGVPRELRERIFEPFFTTKPQGQGTGLGLTTSRDIVVRHGGTLEAFGAPGNQVFSIQVPLQPPSWVPAEPRRARSKS
ncbi:MAG: response regulator [Deltaproteobacteria bacterium]|nr:response regulator [Deltaproteobacteria bacterium]